MKQRLILWACAIAIIVVGVLIGRGFQAQNSNLAAPNNPQNSTETPPETQQSPTDGSPTAAAPPSSVTAPVSEKSVRFEGVSFVYDTSLFPM